MSKMVNVNREIKDAFYRYKMPEILCKIEGRGNGIKTAIPNMVEVAKALDRPPSYVTKYLGVELGAQTQMYPDEERYIVNGAFEASRFQDALDGFIKRYVLCEACSNPETDLRVTKKKEIESKCRACGHRQFLPQSHKLTTFILNNPPDGSDSSGKTKGKTKEGKSKEERRARKREGGALADGEDGGGEESSTNAHANGGGAGAGAGAGGEDSGTVESPSGDGVTTKDGDDDDEDEDWSVDASEEAARLRAAALSTGVSGLTMTGDLDKPMPERLLIFESYIEAKMKMPKFPAKEIVGEAERLDCKEKGVMVLVGTLFKTGDVFDLIKIHQGLFQRFTVDNPKAAKYCIGAFEKLAEMRPELVPLIAKIFKDLYDKDVIEEESFIAWADKASKKNVSSKQLATEIQSKAKPFIDWLREAEEEESEDDDMVAFEAATIVAKPTAAAAATATAAPTAAAAAAAADDDIDIDNI